MFEALFILTTIDAGTRVGRFMVQDLMGLAWRPLGDTRSLAGNVGATALFVAAWGWFLYQGVVDPLGGINSLWPIFGVANQLLAVIALALGTTVLIKMGKARHMWVTLLPLAWLLSVTMTAGWMKIFSPDPRLGFLSAAAAASQPRQAFNAHVDAAVTAAFLILVAVIVAANARVWWLLLRGRRAPDLREEPLRRRAGSARIRPRRPGGPCPPAPCRAWRRSARPCRGAGRPRPGSGAARSAGTGSSC